MWTNLSILVGLMAAALVMLEKQLPPPEVLTDIHNLTKGLQEWRGRGKLYEVHGHKMFGIVEGNAASADVIWFVHGFPSSSHDYHRVFPELAKDFRLVAFDHLGFGFSDKPNATSEYTYSMADQAEMALSLLSQLLKVNSKDAAPVNVHAVAHDMGDSVLTEILARRDRGQLPDMFKDLFKSVTFTNGGMVYAHSSLRLSQYALKTPILGEWLNSLQGKLRSAGASAANRLNMQQLRSVWGAEETNRDEDIREMLLMNQLNGGDAVFFKTILYLNDRKRFEPRWRSALSRLDLPVMLFWGDSDAVAPMDIPKTLAKDTIKADKFTGKTMKGAGHFLMLENPKAYADTLKEFIQSTMKK